MCCCSCRCWCVCGQVAVERVSPAKRKARVVVPAKLVKDLFKKAVEGLQVGTAMQ